MSGQELTRDEVFALAGAFRVEPAKTLLSLAGFPSSDVPETGYSNAREFWGKVAEQLADGVMANGRVKILEAARDWFPANEKLAAFAAAAAAEQPSSAPVTPAPVTSGPAVAVAGGQGAQVGDHNKQINYFVARDVEVLGPGGFAAAPVPPAGRALAALRVLVLGASPVDERLPHVRADREAHAIERIAAPDRIELKVVLGAEATDVQYVGTFRPDIVHFVCHGTTDSLVFSDPRGESDPVAATRLAKSLRFYRENQGVRLRGIVLAACDGESLAPFFTEVADTVIAHRGKLADQCGVAFAQQFYALLNAQAAGHAAGQPAAPGLAGVAREAAQLTAQYSAACDPVIANLIVRQNGG